jgi:hypothetical protein
MIVLVTPMCSNFVTNNWHENNVTTLLAIDYLVYSIPEDERRHTMHIVFGARCT